MIALLDTHTLLLAVLSPHRLSRPAFTAIGDPGNVLLVSAASAWEVATKVRLGKLPGAEVFERNFLQDIAGSGYILRAVTVEDGLRAGRLLGPHQDPFDRIIAAQALADDIPVISADSKLDVLGVRRIW